MLGSLRCDCRDQLETALRMIGQMERGILLYMRQEGRGIGLINKIRAYALQDRGLDTVEANLKLGFAPELRDYGVGAQILYDLGVRKMRFMTNNPKKIGGLEAIGVKVAGRIPLVMKPNQYNRFYLETKAAKSGHWMDFAGKVHLEEQSDLPIVSGVGPDEVSPI